jgi:hypothetical protein
MMCQVRSSLTALTAGTRGTATLIWVNASSIQPAMAPIVCVYGIKMNRHTHPTQFMLSRRCANNG